MEKLLTKKDIAEALQVDERTVDRLTADRVLPAPRKIGRSVRWVEAEVTAAIQAAPTSEPLVPVRFKQSWAAYQQGEVAGFAPSETALLVLENVAELVDLSADWPRVRPLAIHLLRRRKIDETRRIWRQRGIDLAERGAKLAAERDDDGGPEADEGDGDDSPTGPADIPPDVQGLRERAIRRGRGRKPVKN